MEHAEVLIIGAGPAGLYAAEAAAIRSAQTVLAGAEKYPPYYRPRLSKMLSAPEQPEALAIKPKEWFLSRGISFMPGFNAEKVDPENRKVFFEDGSAATYGRLILAAGSHSFIPAIPGVEKTYALRSYDDAAAIYSEAIRTGRAVVFGGGLLGLEAAFFLREAGVEVTVIERSAWLLSRQLPKEGGEFLASYLSRHGLKFVLGADTEKQQDKTKGACVIAAAGVRPNTAFLQGSGVALNAAVVVDEAMRTNLPDIFACGDIAEFHGKCPGLFPIAMEQGKVAGANAVGGNETYKETTPSPMLKIGGLSVFSAGDNGSGTAFCESAEGAFRSVSVRDNILIGGALIGDVSKAAKLKNAVAGRIPVADVKTPGDVLDAL